ncbi:hypothetical protein Ocin01_15535 [Orchesella cincta]|uniref:CUB domain-containing protein n=1 Tax=Orchesella cincta TaxID=48709 RepID=A0A1D2MDR0_ORCCI|nr:hypothetical protein Ocin01_15535 [Orchesella cincta]
MNLRGILATCVCAIFHFTKSENVDSISNSISTQPRILTVCGQTLIADSGTIQYKLNQTYDADELCVFMIRFESGYLQATFSLESNGLSDVDSDAVSIFKDLGGLVSVVNLGLDRQNVTFNAVGAVVIFRTNSSSGTGFQLSFTCDGVIFPDTKIFGESVLFDDEMGSPLTFPFPSNITAPVIHNYFFFTAGSKLISEPDTFLRLNLTAVLGDVDDTCFNLIEIHSFETELKFEKSICEIKDDGVLFEFATRGLFFVMQRHITGTPITTGEITWDKVSTR